MIINTDNHVVLVDENDNVLGTEDKLTVHHLNTPLHRGFSVFVFNDKKEIIIQKRSSNKKTWAKFWSNSFCGHPRLNESYEEAVHRYSLFELGIPIQKLFFISNYRYKFTLNNITENEICPIYLALSNSEVNINKDEIEEIKILKWTDFLTFMEKNLDSFSPWCIEEVEILKNSSIFNKVILSI
ncbi:MAG TPA: isopentenyl-diphosphate Delta-isomerase [Rickettsia endosymbiont of Pyrocoelia pectoralis]|nr:isopentenyl-diphosphate Delta-isomerase [Rickettsia endosymbiont of Pyrocoelia pectoralis]